MHIQSIATELKRLEELDEEKAKQRLKKILHAALDEGEDDAFILYLVLTEELDEELAEIILKYDRE